MLLMTVSCRQSKLEALAESLDKECPISLGSLGYLAGANCSGDDYSIVITVFVEESFNDPDILNANKDLWKRCLIQGQAGSDNKLCKGWYKEIGDAGGNLKIEIQGMKGKETRATLTLSSEELCDIGEAKANPLDLLKSQIDLTNIQLPIDVDEGMRLTKVTLEGKYFVFNYVLNEELYYVEAFDNYEEVKKSMLEDVLLDSEPGTQLMLKLLKETGKGIAYRYIGNVSGTEVLIKIESWEL